ncbi:reverse transcriptase domain-containing protein [Tanacetum coccineum]
MSLEMVLRTSVRALLLPRRRPRSKGGGGMSNAGQPETTVDEYLTKVRDDSGPGIVKPLFEENIKFEFCGQCIDELKENMFFGSENEDPHEHISNITDIIDLSTLQEYPGTRKQASSIKTIEGHLGRIAEIIHRREVGSIPSFTETNPRGLAYAITTRSGLSYNPPKNPLEEINNTLNKTTENISTKKVVTPDNQKITTETSAPPIPFPRRLKKEKEKEQFKKLFENLKQLSINILFIDALEQMPKYAKFIKDLLTQRGRGQSRINKALAYLGASISLMPYSMFVFPVDFVVLDMKEDHIIPIILGRPFPPSDDDTRHSVDIINLSILDHVQENFPLKPFDSILFEPINHHLPTKINSLWDDNEGEQDLINQISGDLELESEDYTKPTLFAANMFEGEKPTTKLKDLPSHLEYDFLNNNQEFPIIISSLLSPQEKELLLGVLTKHKSALAWKVADIKVQPQCRLNPKVQDIMKAEIVKLLNAGLIYAISDSPWVSPIHVVPKKEGITVATNNDNELVLTRTVTGILPIPLAPEDQEKTTFTCPYGTFTYRRMPFGLCNAPSTFQRCVTAIFHDMCKDFMEVFMYDFFIFGNSFDSCLNNLSKMLARCEETNLVLNWEKCHVMVKEGIV